MSALTQEEAIQRVKAAFAEMGFGHVEVYPYRDGVSWDGHLPPAVAWQAGWLTSECGKRALMPCFACYRDSGSMAAAEPAHSCSRGNCANPDGPARPPRELLVAAR